MLDENADPYEFNGVVMFNKQPENRVTNEEYWNNVWSPLGGSCGVLSESDFYFGQNGLFSKLIQKRLGDLAGRSVLEFGGGGNNFRLLSMAKWSGAVVTALDFSGEGLKVLNELFRINGCNATTVQDDILNWKPLEQYDVVVHWGVLEHFVDPMPMLKKSVEALKPGGILLFSMPNMEAIAARFWRKWSPENWSKHVFHSTKSIQSALIELGLVDVDNFYFGVPFFKAAEWENESSMQYAVDAMQKLGSASARVFPIYHRVGHRLISMERGFCAKMGNGSLVARP